MIIIKNMYKWGESMKHIVMVIGNYKNGGVAMRSTNLANSFAEKGNNVTILVMGEITEDIFYTLSPGVEVVPLKKYAQEHKNDVSLSEIFSKRKKRFKLLKRLRYISKYFGAWDKYLSNEIRCLRKSEELCTYISANPDSIYIPFGIAYFENVVYAGGKKKTKIIYAERSYPEKELEAYPLGKKSLMKLFENAKHVIVQTKEVEDFLKVFLKKKSIVIHNPLKVDLPDKFSGKRKNIIVNFCRISEEKNLPMLIDAAVMLHKEHPEYSVEIYGNTVVEEEAALRSALVEKIENCGAEDYIKILPPRADIHKIVRDYAMFVSTSDFEGLSNSMLEAMAIGLPCVCTDCAGGGAREVINNGENGLLVPVKDTEALYRAIKIFIEEPELAEKCSGNAYKIRDDLSVEKISQQWLEIIESV